MPQPEKESSLPNAHETYCFQACLTKVAHVWVMAAIPSSLRAKSSQDKWLPSLLEIVRWDRELKCFALDLLERKNVLSLMAADHVREEPEEINSRANTEEQLRAAGELKAASADHLVRIKASALQAAFRCQYDEIGWPKPGLLDDK